MKHFKHERPECVKGHSRGKCRISQETKMNGGKKNKKPEGEWQCNPESTHAVMVMEDDGWGGSRRGVSDGLHRRRRKRY